MKKLLTKSILLIAGLLVGNSAWAKAGDVVTNAKVAFDGSATFANSSAITYTNAEAEVGSSTGYIWKDKGNGVGGALVGDDDKHLRLSNGYFEITMIGEDAGTKDIVTIAFDLAFGYQYVSNGTAEQRFIISDKDGKEVITESFNVNSRTLASSTMGLTTDDVFLPSASADTNWGNKVHFVVTFNYATNQMSLSTSCSVANNKTQELVKDIPSDVSTIKKLKVQSYSIATMRGLLFDNILITTTEGNYAVESSTYKVKYVANGVEIKEAATRKGDVGSDITLTPEDKTLFYSKDGSKKYVYKSDDAEGKTIAAEDATIVTVTFDEYEKYNYTVTAKNGSSVLKTLVSGNAYTDEGEKNVYWSKYIKIDNQWYETKNPYGKTITAAGNTDVAYTAADIYDFIECESTSYKSAGDQTNATGASGGVGVLLNSKSAMATTTKIAAGIYDISVYAYVRRANDDKLKLQYSTDNSTWNDVETLIFESNKAQTQTAKQVILAEDSYIRFLDVVGQNSCHYYDYIVIKESTVPVTITDAGWATLYTTAALNFSSVEGLTAYTATLSDNTVTLTEVDDVPAGTGVVLQGAAGTYNIPVAASSTTAKGDLQGSTTATTVDATNKYYVLAKTKDGDNVQFSPVKKDESIAAGKAYLVVDGGEANLRVVFGDEATAISGINVAKAESDVIYNVAGQRVNSSYKGIVIKNGKKYLNK